MKILIVDDHPVVLNGLASYLNYNKQYDIIGRLTNGIDAVKFFEKNNPDITILDLSMPDIDGLETAKRILCNNKDARILFCSVSMCRQKIYNCYKIGGLGFISKNKPMIKIVEAINCIKEGKLYFSDIFTKKHFVEYDNNSKLFKNKKKKLSVREKDILSFVAQGYSNKEISETIHIHVKTVENHRRNIRQKLNLAGSAEFIKFAIEFSGLENEKLS